MARGERNGGAKLSEATALAILKRRAETGLSAAKLAREFLCGIGTVKHLLRGDTWAHLPRPAYRRANRLAKPGMLPESVQTLIGPKP